MGFIISNLATIIISMLLLAATGVIVQYLYKKKKAGICPGCGGCCKTCGHCAEDSKSKNMKTG